MNKITINFEKCKGCGVCIEACPRGVFAVSEHANQKGLYPCQVVNPESCVGCGICVVVCPDVAISLNAPRSEKEVD